MTMRGMIPNNDRFNNSIKTNVNFRPINGLTISSNITIGRANSNNISSTGDRRNNPLEAVYQSSYIPMDRLIRIIGYQVRKAFSSEELPMEITHILLHMESITPL
jgi:hypothetical protein